MNDAYSAAIRSASGRPPPPPPRRSRARPPRRGPAGHGRRRPARGPPGSRARAVDAVEVGEQVVLRAHSRVDPAQVEPGRCRGGHGLILPGGTDSLRGGAGTVGGVPKQSTVAPRSASAGVPRRPWRDPHGGGGRVALPATTRGRAPCGRGLVVADGGHDCCLCPRGAGGAAVGAGPAGRRRSPGSQSGAGSGPPLTGTASGGGPKPPAEHGWGPRRCTGIVCSSLGWPRIVSTAVREARGGAMELDRAVRAAGGAPRAGLPPDETDGTGGGPARGWAQRDA